MTIICAHCGERRPHEARGLCYEKARMLGLHHAYPKTRTPKPKPDRRAYWRARYVRRPVRHTARNAALCAAYESGATGYQLAARFGLGKSQVYAIVKGRTP